MKLAEKIRYLREVEGSLRSLDRAMTQQELVRAIEAETGGRTISQSYLSQLESGTRPHLTNTTRLLLARFFKVHPGYLVEDPEDFQSELRTGSALEEDKLDLWLVAGAERFGRRDGELCRALLAVAHHENSRGCLLLLESILKTPQLAAQLDAALHPERDEAKGETVKAVATMTRPTTGRNLPGAQSDLAGVGPNLPGAGRKLPAKEGK
jgi:transcriptional regulator with XRE-family HTH domain